MAESFIKKGNEKEARRLAGIAEGLETALVVIDEVEKTVCGSA